MHHTVNVSPRLHSVYSFDYSRSSSNSSFGYVYAPDHCKPVLIRSARGNIYSSRGLVIPKGKTAVVTLVKYGTDTTSNWDIKIYDNELDAKAFLNALPGVFSANNL